MKQKHHFNANILRHTHITVHTHYQKAGTNSISSDQQQNYRYIRLYYRIVTTLGPLINITALIQHGTH